MQGRFLNRQTLGDAINKNETASHLIDPVKDKRP